ncbi:hypothetical protein [Nannocystis sp.]|uniref:hypothetical protein n=1 Tax=Nannocystis sp. TaxID=1962667 RepID=UPI0025F5237E|nr:hypothetical protein [Nannocystis sp.]MBK7828414.1 hypothetical protein [Nannocystis sp.]
MDGDWLRVLSGADADGSRSIVGLIAAKKLGVALSRVISRFFTGRAHGVYATCVEEIGREFYLSALGGKLWSLIKKEAEDTFEADDRGGRMFVNALAAASADRSPPRITIVGHSAGSIYAGRLVVELARCGLHVDDLVLLAAAVRYDVFGRHMAAADDLLPSAVRRFHFIALDDDCERGYWEVPGVYPRSLLYLVSGAAEDTADHPLLGMERFWTREHLAPDPHVRAILARSQRHWLARRADRTVLRHGGLFDPTAAPETVRLLAAILGATP